MKGYTGSTQKKKYRIVCNVAKPKKRKIPEQTSNAAFTRYLSLTREESIGDSLIKRYLDGKCYGK